MKVKNGIWEVSSGKGDRCYIKCIDTDPILHPHDLAGLNGVGMYYGVKHLTDLADAIAKFLQPTTNETNSMTAIKPQDFGAVPDIDWTKPLECDLGDVVACDTGDTGGLRFSIRVTYLDISYMVDIKTGENSVMFLDRYTTVINKGPLPDSFTVRNKKTNRDRAIEIMHEYKAASFEEYVDALIKADLLKEDE